MANTRQFDRTIRIAQGKLDAIGRKETWALTAGEQARLAGHAAVLVGKATRHKSAPRAERAMQEIWAGAASRLRAEISAASAAKEAVVNEAAAAKVAKKSSGWW